jgi:membrane associated rhomboid family serine protease
MRNSPSNKPFSSIPGFSQNAVLQLIIASGIGFITYHMIRVITVLAGADRLYFETNFTPNLALPPAAFFISKLWTLVTYGWVHTGFWDMFTNMVWLYAFGSIVQVLVGYRQVIPLFVFCLLTGGVCYELAQYLPNTPGGYILGAQAGVAGLAVAAITLSPSYRIYFAEHMSIHISIIVIIFFALMIVNTNLQVPQLLLIGGGSLMGFIYVRLLKAGYQPGMWVYTMFDRLSTWAEPDENEIRSRKNKRRNEVMHNFEPKRNTSQRIDDILDKINQKGYESLTQEEKDILMNAGKDKHP